MLILILLIIGHSTFFFLAANGALEKRDSQGLKLVFSNQSITDFVRTQRYATLNTFSVCLWVNADVVEGAYRPVYIFSLWTRTGENIAIRNIRGKTLRFVTPSTKRYVTPESAEWNYVWVNGKYD